MNKIRKGTLAVIVFLMGLGVHAEMPVIDITNFFNGLEQLYEAEQQTNNMLQQLERAAQQAEMAYQNMMSLSDKIQNIGSIGDQFFSMKDPFSSLNSWENMSGIQRVAAVRNSINNSVKSQHDMQKRFVSNAVNLLNKPVYENGGGDQINLGMLLGIGHNGEVQDLAWQSLTGGLAQDWETHKKMWTSTISEEELQAYEKRYGSNGYIGFALMAYEQKLAYANAGAVGEGEAGENSKSNQIRASSSSLIDAVNASEGSEAALLETNAIGIAATANGIADVDDDINAMREEMALRDMRDQTEKALERETESLIEGNREEDYFQGTTSNPRIL